MNISESKDFLVSSASLKEVRTFSRDVFNKIELPQDQKDELVLEVNGMVCGMCAFGIQEGLSELSFLNNKKFEEDGIEVDLDTQMIYIPIDLSKTIDQLEAVQIVKDVGYDTVFIYTNFDGKGVKKAVATKLIG